MDGCEHVRIRKINEESEHFRGLGFHNIRGYILNVHNNRNMSVYWTPTVLSWCLFEPLILLLIPFSGIYLESLISNFMWITYKEYLVFLYIYLQQ